MPNMALQNKITRTPNPMRDRFTLLLAESDSGLMLRSGSTLQRGTTQRQGLVLLRTIDSGRVAGEEPSWMEASAVIPSTSTAPVTGVMIATAVATSVMVAAAVAAGARVTVGVGIPTTAGVGS